ncbi:MAG: SDR family oxidoreductase [Pseudomonadota bacterium]
MKTMLITGASSGIGKATAEAAMDAGWRVGLLARRAEPLQALSEMGDALVLPADVTDLASVEAAVGQVAASWGRLDCVFNNAGIFTPAGLIDEIDPNHWHQSVNVNLTGMFNVARACFAQMRRQDPQGGRIINNGSISAHSPREGSIAYTATKHGVTGLTKTLSLDGRPFDIACGQIDIGNARTPIIEAIAQKAVAAGQTPPETMAPSQAAEAVMHMAGLPLETNVQFMTIVATKMPYIGRG